MNLLKNKVGRARVSGHRSDSPPLALADDERFDKWAWRL